MSNPVLRPRSETLGDLLDEIAAATPRRLAVVFRDERLDYAAVKARADGFALALLAAGVRRGDRVALLVSNHMILVPPPRRIGEGEEHREIT
jgi:fatty-acyl-CoA synthase